MTKEELAISINNAINRGVSMEEAMQSFLNAGYNAQEVKGAVDILKSGTLNIVYGSNQSIESKDKPLNATPKTALQVTSNSQQKTHTHNKYFLPLVIGILALFIIGLIVALIIILS